MFATVRRRGILSITQHQTANVIDHNDKMSLFISAHTFAENNGRRCVIDTTTNNECRCIIGNVIDHNNECRCVGRMRMCCLRRRGVVNTLLRGNIDIIVINIIDHAQQRITDADVFAAGAYEMTGNYN